MKATLPETGDAPEIVDGYEVRTRQDRLHRTERAEVKIDDHWVLLWSNRRLSKGGANAWKVRQQDLKRAVWEKSHGRKPRLCSRCGLMQEGDERVIQARSCGVCKEFRA